MISQTEKAPQTPQDSRIKSLGKPLVKISISIIGFTAACIGIYEFAANPQQVLKDRQYQNLLAAHEPAEIVISDWNQVEDLAKKRTHAITVIESIDAIVLNYENLEISELSKLTEVIYNWHLAKLYIIQADVKYLKGNKSESHVLLKKAEELIEIAQKDIKNPKNFSTTDSNYIKDQKLVNKLNRTKLNSLALLIDGKPESFDATVEIAKAKRMLSELDGSNGCKKLNHLDYRHKRILRGLGCQST